MEDILVQQGLDMALLGAEQKPESMKDKAWTKLDRKALSSIRLCLADEVKCNILSEGSAASLWARLKKDYTGKSLANRWYWKNRLYKLTMLEGTSLHDHINQFNGIISELGSLEIKVDEEDKALFLLSSLPHEYENFITSLLCGKEETGSITLVEVVNALKSNEIRKKTVDGEGVRLGAALSTVDNKKQNNGAKSGVRCYNCGKKGHIKKNCRELRNKEETESMVGCVDSELGGDLGFCLLVDSGKEIYSEDWILDSGCSNHVCLDRRLFSSYRASEGGSVITAAGGDCKVIGEGTVTFRMYDGSTVTLSDVKHVPTVQRKLISLGALEERDCRYTARGGVLSVWKGSRKVIRSRKVGHHNLYVLEGSVKNCTVESTPIVPEPVSVPPLGSHKRDLGVRSTSVLREEDKEVGGDRIGVGNSVSTSTHEIYVGKFKLEFFQRKTSGICLC